MYSTLIYIQCWRCTSIPGLPLVLLKDVTEHVMHHTIWVNCWWTHDEEHTTCPWAHRLEPIVGVLACMLECCQLLLECICGIHSAFLFLFSLWLICILKVRSGKHNKHTDFVRVSSVRQFQCTQRWAVVNCIREHTYIYYASQLLDKSGKRSQARTAIHWWIGPWK